MNASYPIVEERLLEPTPRRGLLGMGRQVRDGAELPKPAAHQVLVYRVAGDFVLDPARLGRTDAEVVNATNVSVVDMRRDVEVAVQLPIPSGEASEFTVVVTFVCCVTDAVTVVRDGQSDAQAVLHAYLRGHRKIFELGLDHRMTDINEVRRSVNAQVTAYTTIKPPLIAGITATLASVEVLTPQELAEFEKTRRGQRETHTLRREQQDYEHRLLVEQRLGDQQLGKISRQHEHDMQTRQHKQDILITADRQRAEHELSADRQRFEYMMSAEGQQSEQELSAGRQRSEQALEAQRRAFVRREAAETAAILRDHEDVLRLAYASGEVDATKLAELFRADRDRDEGLRQAELGRAREDEDRRRQEDREDLLHQREWEREERAAEREAKRQDKQWEHEQALRLAEERRLEAHQQNLWTREDTLRREAAEREDKRRRLEVSLNVLREVANRGHLDMVNVNVERLIAEILPPADSPADADGRAELETRPAIEHDENDPQDAADLREEDDDPS